MLRVIYFIHPNNFCHIFVGVIIHQQNRHPLRPFKNVRRKSTVSILSVECPLNLFPVGRMRERERERDLGCEDSR